ncbi:MAG: hypothetical protein Hyperionvirus1_59 [Hyperionvirus sp.]|uniref:AMMECR1 domain-containing protein n=1 Tax=Hyperionvirus sp. TaxID=2487770 RepID=A0A3G5A5F2_9VIRU|nr:MAG: hypothetical protein Hyperionvirus1_59 [Hyperionvirus sp.]
MNSDNYGSNTILDDIYYPQNDGSWHEKDFMTQIKNIKNDFTTEDKKPFIYKSFAIVVPHAGYSWCGETLVKTYASVDWTLISEVIMLCTFHANKNLIIIPSFKHIKYDNDNIIAISDKINTLKNNPLFHVDDNYFINEHSFRNQLPMLLFFKKGVKIIPLLIGNSNMQQVGSAIIQLFEPHKTLFIVNTDLTHYGENYSNRFDINILGSKECAFNEAACVRKKDAEFIKSIMILNETDMRRYSNAVCGRNAISLWIHIVVSLPEIKNDPKIISYSSSLKPLDTSFVTYVGINYPIFSIPNLESLVRLPRIIMNIVRYIHIDNPNIDLTDVDTLFKLVKSIIKTNYTNNISKGIFVTIEQLYENKYQLAGCIGIFYKDAKNYNLIDNIIKYTLFSAFRDHRFVSPFLTSEGLAKILTPQYRFKLNFLEDDFFVPYEKFWDVYVPCLHGITLEEGHLKATFLASVMEENKWVNCMHVEDKNKSENKIFYHLLRKMGSNKSKYDPNTMRISLYPNYEFTDDLSVQAQR